MNLVGDLNMLNKIKGVPTVDFDARYLEKVQKPDERFKVQAKTA